MNFKGELTFKDLVKTNKHKLQSDWKKVGLLLLKDDTESYYAWLLKKRFGLTLNRTLRGSHITIINDKFLNNKKWETLSNQFEGKEVEFNYSPENIRTDGLHWWINVKSKESEDIRELFGLNRNPYFGFHLTLGYSNEKNLLHSQYIHKICVSFNL